MQEIILITGATSGIGMQTARVLAQNKYNLILCGRNESKLESLKKELSEYTKIHTLKFDISNKEEIISQIKTLPKEFLTIDKLINNAGNAHGLDTFGDGDLEDFEKMILHNVLGTIYVTKLTLPLMQKSSNPHIINVGSLAAKYTYPKGTVYCASKSAVDKFSEGLRMDLIDKDIKVSAIHPGLVNTDFSNVRFKGDLEKAKKVYEGYEPLLAQDIADTILFMITRPKHVNIADIVVLPKAQASSSIVNKNS